MAEATYSKTKLMERLYAHRQKTPNGEIGPKKRRKTEENGRNGQVKEGILQNLQRKSSGIDKILELLPKIEGITYCPELSSFKSSVPARYTRRPIVEYFSTKKYDVRDAWLMSVYHLYTNISNLIFRRPASNGLGVRRKSEAAKAAKAISKFMKAHTPERVPAPEAMESPTPEGAVGSTPAEIHNGALDPTEPQYVANSLKPWHRNVYWIPSISRWRTFYVDDLGVKHTKTFTPAVFGGVKEAYEAAVEFCDIIKNIGQVTASNVRRISMVQRPPKQTIKHEEATNGAARKPKANGRGEHAEERVPYHGITEFNTHIKRRIIENAAENMERENGTRRSDLRADQLKRSPEIRQEVIVTRGEGRTEYTDSTNWDDIVDEIVVNVEVKREETSVKLEDTAHAESGEGNGVKWEGESYDAEFLSGLDAQGLFIPIPSDWREF